VFLAGAGFACAAFGSALAAGRAGSARAGDLRDGRASGAWRTQDYVFLAVLAIVSGALYWWWLQPYSWVAPLVPGAGQVAQEAVFGVWFLSGLLGGYVIRRPGAAVLANTLAALAEVLLGAPAGPILVVTGLMQALGPELVFAATGYRRWGWSVMILAGISAGLVALPWNWFRLGYFALQPGLQVALVVARIAGGALAGVLAKVIGDLLASTGALSYFPIGRERMREI
jgi:energy-coupling factor transport system substrate-specific component